jgi:hypothetical protein
MFDLSHLQRILRRRHIVYPSPNELTKSSWRWLFEEEGGNDGENTDRKGYESCD